MALRKSNNNNAIVINRTRRSRVRLGSGSTDMTPLEAPASAPAPSKGDISFNGKDVGIGILQSVKRVAENAVGHMAGDALSDWRRSRGVE